VCKFHCNRWPRIAPDAGFFRIFWNDLRTKEVLVSGWAEQIVRRQLQPSRETPGLADFPLSRKGARVTPRCRRIFRRRSKRAPQTSPGAWSRCIHPIDIRVKIRLSCEAAGQEYYRPGGQHRAGPRPVMETKPKKRPPHVSLRSQRPPPPANWARPNQPLSAALHHRAVLGRPTGPLVGRLAAGPYSRR